MILCDSGVWLALVIEDHPHYAVANRWLGSIEGPSSVFFCRATQQSFLRQLTNASIFSAFGRAPLTNREAWSTYDGFFTDGRIAYQSREPAGLESHWRQFAMRDSNSPKLWMDAYLAAFAVAGGYQMVTTDRGFKQFDGLDLVLVGSS